MPRTTAAAPWALVAGLVSEAVEIMAARHGPRGHSVLLGISESGEREVRARIKRAARQGNAVWRAAILKERI